MVFTNAIEGGTYAVSQIRHAQGAIQLGDPEVFHVFSSAQIVLPPSALISVAYPALEPGPYQLSRRHLRVENTSRELIEYYSNEHKPSREIKKLLLSVFYKKTC